MSYNPHRAAALAMADKWMADPELREDIAYAYELTRDTHPDRAAVVDAFGQPHRGWDAGQLFALACLDELLISGEMLMAEHPIASTPSRDRYRAANQAALELDLDPDSRVAVDMVQRGGDSDGRLTWKKPIPGHGVAEQVTIPPATAPLEIGGTDASTTCLHLCRRGMVARWPYGHAKIWVFVLRRRDLINSVRLRRVETDSAAVAGLAEFWEYVWWGWHGRGPATQRRGLPLDTPRS